MKGRQRSSRAIGLLIFIFSIFVFILYAYVLLDTSWSLVVLKLTVLGAIAVIVSVLSWIGYTMATASHT